MATFPAEYPSRVREQRRHALERANELRSERAALLARWRTLGRYEGCRLAAEYVADPPDFLAGMKVMPFLVRLPGIGERTMMKIAHAAGLTPKRTIGSMTPRQRQVVVERLERWSRPFQP